MLSSGILCACCVCHGDARLAAVAAVASLCTPMRSGSSCPVARIRRHNLADASSACGRWEMECRGRRRRPLSPALWTPIDAIPSHVGSAGGTERDGMLRRALASSSRAASLQQGPQQSLLRQLPSGLAVATGGLEGVLARGQSSAAQPSVEEGKDEVRAAADGSTLFHPPPPPPSFFVCSPSNPPSPPSP